MEHPWSSALHDVLTFYFVNALAAREPALWVDLIENHGLHVFIMEQLEAKRRTMHGYAEFLMGIARMVEKRRNEWGSLCGQAFEKRVAEMDWKTFCQSSLR